MNTTAAKSKTATPRKPRQKPKSAAQPTPPAVKPTKALTDAQRLEMLEAMSPDQLKSVADVINALGDNSAPQSKPPAAPEETESPTFESVDVIARGVMARLLTGSFGSKILDFDSDLSEFQNVWLDIQDGIRSALPNCDTDELHTASVYFSVR